MLGDTITATDGHPFWVNDQGQWVDAGDLEPGDRLLLADGSTTAVEATVSGAAKQRVHNLTVDGTHTYYVVVDSSSVLVHNCRKPLAATQREAIDNATDSSRVLRCSYCDEPLTTSAGSSNSLEFDHVVPCVDGGGREIGNIVASCRTCNRSKGSKGLADWLAWLE